MSGLAFFSPPVASVSHLKKQAQKYRVDVTEVYNFCVSCSSFICLHTWAVNVSLMIRQLFYLLISPSVLKEINTGKRSDS